MTMTMFKYRSIFQTFGALSNPQVEECHGVSWILKHVRNVVTAKNGCQIEISSHKNWGDQKCFRRNIFRALG